MLMAGGVSDIISSATMDLALHSSVCVCWGHRSCCTFGSSYCRAGEKRLIDKKWKLFPQKNILRDRHDYNDLSIHKIPNFFIILRSGDWDQHHHH